MLRYFANIVGKYCAATQKALKKLSGLDLKMIAPLHGPVWRKDLNWVISRYDKWSKYELDNGVLIVYGSMYGNTEKIAEALARKLSEHGIKDIRLYDASKTHPSYIIRDLFKYKGFMIGSVAYNNQLFPPIETLVHKIQHMGVKNHLLGIFGSFSWNGGGVKNLKKFAEDIKWDLVYDPIEEKGSLKGDKLFLINEMAKNMADRLKADEA
jgi:flavorubredoxin